MVLEEELIFSDKADAEEFIKHVRAAGCSGKVRTEHAIIPETMFHGRIQDLLKLLDREIDRHKDDPEMADLVALSVTMKAGIERRRENLRQFFDEHPVGAIIPERSLMQDFATIIGKMATGEEAGEPDPEEADAIITAIGINALLEENGLVEETDEGLRLVGTIEPEEAYTYCPEHPFVEVEPGTLREYGIDVKITVIAEERYIASLGPEIMLIDDPEPLWDALDGMDVDEDDVDILRTTIAFKQFIIERIMTVLEERGRASREELLEESLSFDAVLNKEQDSASFILTEEYVNGVLNDLKKVGLITGKDSKIKPVRAK